MFPLRPIPAGEIIIKFEGPIYDKATMAEEKDFSEAIQVRSGAVLIVFLSYACLEEC